MQIWFFVQKKKSKFEGEKKPRKKFSKLKFGFFHMDGPKKKPNLEIWFFFFQKKKSKFEGEKKTRKKFSKLKFVFFFTWTDL